MAQADPVRRAHDGGAPRGRGRPRSRDILPRLAVTLRRSIPFERLHVLRLDRAESFVLYVVGETGTLEITRAPHRSIRRRSTAAAIPMRSH